jgi:hypothetical protein
MLTRCGAPGCWACTSRRRRHLLSASAEAWELTHRGDAEVFGLVLRIT